MYGGADRRGVRKPLIIFTPKRMLRHPRAVSNIDDVTNGAFQEVLGDGRIPDATRVRRVVFCSGQVYYDLLAKREEKKTDDVAVVRLEQIYPFPAEQVGEILSRYPAAAEVAWTQEESRNMGAWRFVEEQFRSVLETSGRTLQYIGRAESASPASGSLSRHQQEQAELLEQAFAASKPEKQNRPARRRK